VSAPAADGTDLAGAVAAAAAALERALAAESAAALPAGALDDLLAALVRVHAWRRERVEEAPPRGLAARGVNPTELMVMASDLLKAGDLQVFELAMWQTYGGG